MNATDSQPFALSLGHLLIAAGFTELTEVLVIRHTYTDDGLQRGHITPESVLDYTRVQGIKNMVGKTPPRWWVCFIADGGHRARLIATYENHGEVLKERTDDHRFFDLKPTAVMDSLIDRLVIDWGKDAVRWAKKGPTAAKCPVLEIADPEAVPFPGYDRIVLDHTHLRLMVEDPRYASWRTALGSVQGIYLITDTSTGRQYVGKADGGERILGRWRAYANDGHGGNKALKELARSTAGTQAHHFQWSILRVFGPSTPTAEVDEAEAHYKRALLTRRFGLNHN